VNALRAIVKCGKCRPGQTKTEDRVTSATGGWFCKRCDSTQYVVDPNNEKHSCHDCPAGARCDGSAFRPLVQSTWKLDKENGKYYIVSCIAGYSLVAEPYLASECRPCAARFYCTGGTERALRCKANMYSRPLSTSEELCVKSDFVEITVSLPMLEEQFTHTRQTVFLDSVAAVAEINVIFVEIKFMQTSRRTSSQSLPASRALLASALEVETLIASTDGNADQLVDNLSEENINRQLVLGNLPRVTMVKPARVVDSFAASSNWIFQKYNIVLVVCGGLVIMLVAYCIFCSFKTRNVAGKSETAKNAEARKRVDLRTVEFSVRYAQQVARSERWEMRKKRKEDRLKELANNVSDANIVSNDPLTHLQARRDAPSLVPQVAGAWQVEALNDSFQRTAIPALLEEYPVAETLTHWQPNTALRNEHISEFALLTSSLLVVPLTISEQPPLWHDQLLSLPTNESVSSDESSSAPLSDNERMQHVHENQPLYPHVVAGRNFGYEVPLFGSPAVERLPTLPEAVLDHALAQTHTDTQRDTSMTVHRHDMVAFSALHLENLENLENPSVATAILENSNRDNIGAELHTTAHVQGKRSQDPETEILEVGDSETITEIEGLPRGSENEWLQERERSRQDQYGGAPTDATPKFEANLLVLGKSEDSVLNTFIGLDEGELSQGLADPLDSMEKEWFPNGFLCLEKEPQYGNDDYGDAEYLKGVAAANEKVKTSTSIVDPEEHADELERLQDEYEERGWKWWLAGANFDYIRYGTVGHPDRPEVNFWLPPQVKNSFLTGQYHGGPITPGDYDTGFYDTPALEIELDMDFANDTGEVDAKGHENQMRKDFKRQLAADLSAAACLQISEDHLPVVNVSAKRDCSGHLLGTSLVIVHVLQDSIMKRGPDECWDLARDLCEQASNTNLTLFSGTLMRLVVHGGMKLRSERRCIVEHPTLYFPRSHAHT